MTNFQLFKWITSAVLILAFFFSTFTIVRSQERAVVTRFGAINRVMEPGLNFKIPFLESANKMDVRIDALPVTELAYSRDAQTISAEVTINYHLDPSQVSSLFREVRKDYRERLVIPSTKESIKAILAQYTAQGLLDNRSQIPVEIKNKLSEELSIHGIIVDNIAVTNIDFDDAYENAIKEKQVQEQNALKQINITKQEEEKKKQEILKAQALSEKTRLEAAALQSAQGQQVIEKIYAEAALEAAKKWNGQLPTQMIPGGTLPFIKLGN